MNILNICDEVVVCVVELDWFDVFNVFSGEMMDEVVEVFLVVVEDDVVCVLVFIGAG